MVIFQFNLGQLVPISFSFSACSGKKPLRIKGTRLFTGLMFFLSSNHRITFKLCLLTWKTLHTAHLPYLSKLITHYLPARALRSSNANFLARPTGITSNFTSRAFSVSAPSTWNSLHTHVRPLDRLSTFKRQLKSHVFQSAFAA